MAKQTETKVPHPTTIQFTATYSFVKIGTNPPNTIAVNTSLDKSKKYFAKVSFTVFIPTPSFLFFFLLYTKVSHIYLI